MKEVSIRKTHKNIGIVLALFIILQAGSGVMLIFKNITISVPHSHAVENHEMGDMNIHYSLPTDSEIGHMENQSDHNFSWSTFINSLHHGGGEVGIIYHLLSGIGMLFMAVTGTLIFLKTRSRNRNQ